jgi:hypothetical protein
MRQAGKRSTPRATGDAKRGHADDAIRATQHEPVQLQKTKQKASPAMQGDLPRKRRKPFVL